MSFENFFEESDKRDFRLWLIAVGAVFLLCFGCWAFYSLTNRQPKVVEERREVKPPLIKSVDRKRRARVEELCSNLPRPEKFHFWEKTIMVENDELTLVRYTFKSARNSEEIMPTFLVWLNANGWKSLPHNQSTFTKGNQNIAFSEVLNDSANYAIYCSETKAEGDAVPFGLDDI